MKRPIDYLIKGVPSNEEIKKKLGIKSFEETSGGRYKTASGALVYGAKKVVEKAKEIVSTGKVKLKDGSYIPLSSPMTRRYNVGTPAEPTVYKPKKKPFSPQVGVGRYSTGRDVGP